MALCVPEMCFWPAKTRKILNFLRCIHVFDLVLKYGSDIKERVWLQLLFYFIVLMGIVASVIGMSFFSCVSGFRLKFSRIALWLKRLQLDSNNDLTTNGLILGFFVGKWLLPSTYYIIYMDWNLQELLNCYFFLTTSNFFDVFVWEVFWFVL